MTLETHPSIVWNKVIIPNIKYNNAVTLMDEGKYVEAISAFEALNGYKDSETKINDCNIGILDGKYNDAVALMDARKYTDAISAFEALNGYKDSETKINDCKYNDAVALMNTGYLDEAYIIFSNLKSYKDASDKAADIRLTQTKEQLKNIKVGSYITFGAYEQDNIASNGKEKIEWLVLEVKDGKALVISKYALDCVRYNLSDEYITYDNCSIRKWLNEFFINSAFSINEKAIISMTTMSADGSSNSSNATQNQAFLLSETEANKYFDSDNARRCKPTFYALECGTSVAKDSNCCCWWLRSVASTPMRIVECVDTDGRISSKGIIKNYIAVRPAMWIDLNTLDQ